LTGKPDKSPARSLVGAGAILSLVFVQIFLGALVAKTGAGLTFNTWPWMDGRFIPSPEQLFAMEPVWRNFFENVMTIQFMHRMVAYLLFVGALLHALDTQQSGPLPAALRAAVVFALVTGQVILGVITLVSMSPLSLSLAHQAGAVAVLAAATVHTCKLSR
jgi:cytochrome c oxidase assembly protein subunit 15